MQVRGQQERLRFYMALHRTCPVLAAGTMGLQGDLQAISFTARPSSMTSKTISSDTRRENIEGLLKQLTLARNCGLSGS